MSISADDMSFKDRLLKAAEHAGVEPGPSAIARSLEINSRQTVHRWLEGSIPDSPMMSHIAKTFGVQLAWLANGEGDMVSPAPADLTPPEQELVGIFRKLSKDRRASLQAIVRALAKAVVIIVITLPYLPSADASSFDIKSVANTHYFRRLATFVLACLRRWRNNPGFVRNDLAFLKGI